MPIKLTTLPSPPSPHHSPLTTLQLQPSTHRPPFIALALLPSPHHTLITNLSTQPPSPPYHYYSPLTRLPSPYSPFLPSPPSLHHSIITTHVSLAFPFDTHPRGGSTCSRIAPRGDRAPKSSSLTDPNTRTPNNRPRPTRQGRSDLYGKQV